jgi:hypothetical protein
MFVHAHACANNEQIRKFQFQRLLRLLRIPEPLASRNSNANPTIHQK